MKTLILILFTLKVSVTATIYHAVPGQTDDTPFITASNKVIDKDNPGGHRWIGYLLRLILRILSIEK